MRSTLIVLLLALNAAGAGAAAATRPRLTSTHVRGLTDTAKQLIVDAVTRSDIVERQVSALEATDVVVYVSDKDALGGSRDKPSAWVGLVSCAGGRRYLLVRVGRWLTPPWVRISDLAHELQHALEIAVAPEVRDEASLARLYKRIGWENEKGRFESRAAIAVGNRVLKQQLGFGR